MIKRLYIDNYKTLVNFEWKPAPMNLLIGGNGSGKTTVFEVLRNLCDFIINNIPFLHHQTLTVWQQVEQQRFELDLEIGGDLYQYQLQTGYVANGIVPVINEERLSINGNPLLIVESGMAVIYRDDSFEPINFLSNPHWSALYSFYLPKDYNRIARFLQAITRIYVLQINPPHMEDLSQKEAERPALYLANFVSWYRALSNNQRTAMVIQHDLQEILAGFSHLEFEKEGLEARYLRFHFQWEGMKKSVPFYLSQLSEGQRMLVALYSLLHIPESDQDNLGFSVSEYALFLDEPDNFISLREIQPWLVRLQDKVFDGAVQASIISHHPEVIDYLLVPNNGAIQTFYFERPSGTVTTIKEFPHSPENILKPSELIARNWI